MTEKTEDDIKQELFEKLLEIWQPDALLEFVRGEYKRGFDAGVASREISKEDLAREYHRGRQSVLDDVRKMFPQHAAQADLKEPIAKSIVEVPSEPETDPPRGAGFPEGTKVTDDKGFNGTVDAEGIIRKDVIAQPKKHTREAPSGPGRGPKITNPNRPEGIPSNFEMCRLVLIDAGVPLTATEIRDRVAKRWWPDVPGDWKVSPFGFLGSGKLSKNSDGKFILPIVVPEKRVIPAKPDPQAVINREVEKRASAGNSAFLHGGKSVLLRSNEFVVACKLRSARGAGHLDAKFLASLVGIRAEAEPMMRDLVTTMNPKLATVGLTVDFYKGFGFMMKDVA